MPPNKEEGPPFFSVVICTFNRDDLLPRALDSVLRQTFQEFEAIVVDAGSSEHTAGIVESHPLKPRYARIPDTGIGGSRDAGLALAGGEYTAFLDDDDEFAPDHLQVRFRILQTNPEIDLLYNGFQTVGSEYVPDLLHEGQWLHVDDPRIFHAGTAVVRTAKAREVGGFTTSYNKHYPDNFLEAALAHHLNIRKVEERTYIYHRFDTSFTGRLGREYKAGPPPSERPQ